MKKLILFLSLLSLTIIFQNCGDFSPGDMNEIVQTLEKQEEADFQSAGSSQNGKTLFKSLSDSRRRYFYRIPSLVVVNNNGYMVAFAEQRVASNEDSGDINIVYRMSFDHGKKWTSIAMACEAGKDTCGNPTAVVDQKTGIIHLFMNSNPGEKAQFGDNKFKEGDRQVLYRQARFSGKKLIFSKIEDLTKKLQFPGTTMDMVGPGTGIQLTIGRHKGRLIIPAARRSFISDNGGNSWKLSSKMSNHSSEASVMELDNGNIVRNDRATASFKKYKRRVLAYSTNGGSSYSTPSIKNDLYDPIAQGSMLRYSKGHLFMANCASTVRRRFLTIKSTKNGRTWKKAMSVDRECGYSSMAKTRDYNVGIIYERRSVNDHLYDGKVPQDIIFKKYKLKDFK